MASIPNGILHNTYNHQTKKDSQDKLHANALYQRYVDVQDKHLYLESENLLTSACLKNSGVSKQNLFVVNGNEETCQTIRQIVPNTFNMMSTEFLQTTEEKFGTIWLDYCCTKEGNSFFHPIDDFRIILNRKLVSSGGVVGFTFSVREPKKHWKKLTVHRHKLPVEKIKMSKKYKNICIKKKINNRNSSKWEHATIDFCEAAFLNISDNITFEVEEFYRYKNKNGRAPPQMYVFFVRVHY
jgi:hypothetical protein